MVLDRLVLAAHFGIDRSQKDESMKEWLVKTRSNRGKLTLRVGYLVQYRVGGRVVVSMLCLACCSDANRP